MLCKENPKGRRPANQQTGKGVPNLLNYLEVAVGNENFKKGQRVGVDKAYVMKTVVDPNIIPPQVSLSGNYDIGLILPKAKHLTLMKDCSLSPLKLPA